MFRSEAITYRADRLSGDVAVAVPVAWQSIGYLIFGSVGAAIIFLSLADYARVETVTGTVIPDSGVAPVLPTRNGILTRLAVRDGQMVAAGDQLAFIRSEEDSADGVSASARIGAAIAQQDASLSAQGFEALSAARAQQSQLAAQQSGLVAELNQLQSQISLQQNLVNSAQKDLDRARIVAERGFISTRDIQFREELVVSRRQSLSQLLQTSASRRATLSEAQKTSTLVAAQARAQNAGLAASRAQVAQQAANSAGERSYVLRAPMAGRVTALTARTGQPASPQTALMTIVPAGSVLQAELAIPSSAIGFIKPGQAVRLAIDAFPYQRFGTVRGKVMTVATSAIMRQSPNGSSVSLYPVTVSLNQTGITAYGRTESLVSGMSLTARIVTEKQSLLEWLFEPLYAVRRR